MVFSFTGIEIFLLIVTVIIRLCLKEKKVK